MVFQSSPTLESMTYNIFPETWLNKLAKKTDFIKRKRKTKYDVIFLGMNSWLLYP